MQYLQRAFKNSLQGVKYGALLGCVLSASTLIQALSNQDKAGALLLMALVFIIAFGMIGAVFGFTCTNPLKKNWFIIFGMPCLTSIIIAIIAISLDALLTKIGGIEDIEVTQQFVLILFAASGVICLLCQLSYLFEKEEGEAK